MSLKRKVTLFGWFKKKKEPNPLEAIYKSLSPAKQELVDLLPEVRQHTPAADLVLQDICNADDASLKTNLLRNVIPMVLEELAEKIRGIGKKTAWATPVQILDAGLADEEVKPTSIGLGYFPNGVIEGFLQFLAKAIW